MILKKDKLICSWLISIKMCFLPNNYLFQNVLSVNFSVQLIATTMVKITVKRNNDPQFLYETTVDTMIDFILQDIATIYNGRLKIERICAGLYFKICILDLVKKQNKTKKNCFLQYIYTTIIGKIHFVIYV